MIPSKLKLESYDREDGKHHKSYNFLYNLKLHYVKGSTGTFET